MGDAATRQTTSEPAKPAHAYDLFVVHAASDAKFVRGYLLPALNLPSSRVLLVDDLPPGGVIVAEIDGRDHEVDDLVGRLDRGERAIYVIGPSGSGKSSLVQAGLLPVIEAGASRLGRTFVTRTMRPGERPAERLAYAIDGDLATPGPAIAAFVARHPPAERALVFIDQLEELFTMATADERQRFIAALQALRASTSCCFVLALRADFYGVLMDSALWPQRAGLSRLDVAPLRGPALAEAITAPAMRVDVHLEARLSDRLVADAADAPGVLPLVQETLRMLWDKRRHRYLGLAAYEAVGDGGRGLDVAIALRANTAMGELTDPQQAIARRVLLRLVSFGEGRADTRRQLSIPAFRSAADDEAALSHVLQHLVAHRLITVDGDPDSEQVGRETLVDLSHEALITGWPEFRRWIDERRADEQRRRRLDGMVSEWIERGRGAASLLDAMEMTEAVHWMASDAAHELGHPAELAKLVAASRAVQAKQRRRRRGVLGGAFAVLAGFSLVVTVLATTVSREADNARFQANHARHLLAQSYMESGRQLYVVGHYQEAVPYLLEARRNGEDGPPLRMMFWEATCHLPLVRALEHQGEVVSAAFSPDGTRVVTASLDGTARVWNAATGKPVAAPLEHHAWVVSAAFSPDGTRVVTASEGKTARVWGAATGTPVTRPLEHRGGVVSAVFSPDGTRVVTTSDKTARVWDAATGQPLTSPLEHQDAVRSAAFSPDGTRVVTTSYKTARVWDADTGQPLTSPLEHHDLVLSAAFIPDGTRVVTTSRDNTAQMWDVRLDVGTLVQWAAVAERSPFVLSGIALVRRSPPKPR